MNIEFIDNSDKVKEEFEKACLKAMTECGLTAENFSKNLSPTVTGLLKNSITYAVAGESPAISEYHADIGDGHGSYSGTMGSSDEMAVYLGTNVEYATYVEMGSSIRRAKPYLKPAIADHASTYQKIIEDELKNG